MKNRWLNDVEWSRSGLPTELQIALTTFGILALELALIRWLPGQIRILAYFNNLILICAFLGMGLGVALGKRRPGLVHAILPVLALFCLAMSLSKELGFASLVFPDRSIHLWGAEGRQTLLSVIAFPAILISCIGIFVAAGAPLGYLFSRMATLRAYSYDLLGSLLGVLLMTASTALHAPPPVWLALGSLPFLLLSRRVVSLVGLLVIVWAGFQSIGVAQYSAYNRIVLQGGKEGIVLQVNQDFHQYIHDLSDQAISTNPNAAYVRSAYDIPFQLTDSKGRALVVGAGTGNDVQAALRNGLQHVTSVDIDSVILALGAQLHPERPYADPRAHRVANDARAFISQYRGEPFDVICYGLLDSHAMFASMSSLRLDNYVYTLEAFQRSWANLSPDGVMCVSFSVFGGEWLSDRLFWTLSKATGTTPIIIDHKLNHGRTFVVSKKPKGLHLERIPFELRKPEKSLEQTRITTDDWPFLYIRPGVFPYGYVIVLSGLLALAAIATPMAYGRSTLGRDFDLPLFMMGAAFLLLETRGITSLALLCGSTWIVNSAIFTAVLLLVWLANLAVMHWKLSNPRPWLLPLLLSVVGVWLFNPNWLIELNLPVRALLGGLVLAAPIGFAGIIVSILLSRSKNASASLGSNLLGSVLGGCLEYTSMVFGLKWLAVMAWALYGLAALFIVRRSSAD